MLKAWSPYQLSYKALMLCFQSRGVEEEKMNPQHIESDVKKGETLQFYSFENTHWSGGGKGVPRLTALTKIKHFGFLLVATFWSLWRRISFQLAFIL